MNLKTNLTRGWTAAAAAALILTLYLYASGRESAALLNTILALDALLFLLALPASLFGAAVVGAAWYVLELDPRTPEGAYLSTVVLALLGAVQWFWLTRFYFPPEAPFQKLDLAA